MPPTLGVEPHVRFIVLSAQIVRGVPVGDACRRLQSDSVLTPAQPIPRATTPVASIWLQSGFVLAFRIPLEAFFQNGHLCLGRFIVF